MNDDTPYVCLVEVPGRCRGLAVEQVLEEVGYQDALDAAAPYKLTKNNLYEALGRLASAAEYTSEGELSLKKYKGEIVRATAMLLRELTTYIEDEDQIIETR